MRSRWLLAAILAFTPSLVQAEGLRLGWGDTGCKVKNATPKKGKSRKALKRRRGKVSAALSKADGRRAKPRNAKPGTKARKLRNERVVAPAPEEGVEAPQIASIRAIKEGTKLASPLRSVQVEGDDWKIAVTDHAVARLIAEINRAGFEEDKILVVSMAAERMFFTRRQVGRIIDAFSFGHGKTTALGLLLPRIVDPQGRGDLLKHFGFGDDEDEAERIIQAAKARRLSSR